MYLHTPRAVEAYERYCHLVTATAFRRGLAVLVGLVGLALAVRYRLSGSDAILFISIAAGLCCARLHLLCAALPVALIVGDLYPWTGSLLVSERDLFLAATLAALLWRGFASPCPVPVRDRERDDECNSSINVSPQRNHVWLSILWLPLAFSVCVSLLRGWTNLQPTLSLDDFGLYGSQWNSVRVAKGYLWGILLVPFLVNEIEGRPSRFCLFSRGMQASALIVALAVIYERAISVGLFNFHLLYRATGPFFSMHTGGQHIDAFWAIALPFLFLPLKCSQSWLVGLIRIVILLVSFYAIVATMSRTIIVWAGIATVALVLQNLLAKVGKPTLLQALTFAVVAMLMLGAAAVAIVQSEPIKDRFIESRHDLLARWQQWKSLSTAANQSWAAKIFGNGLGTIPSIASAAFADPLRPAELIPLKSGSMVLRIRPGKKVYVEQLVDAEAPGPWILQGAVRHSGAATLYAHVCEKTLFDSMRCLEAIFKSQGNAGTSQPFRWTIPIDKLPASTGNGWLSCPVTITVSASGENGFVDITGLRLIDAAGEDLLRNADFHAHSAGWFFTSDDFSSWRAENVWVHLYLEQGVLGVLSFAWLVFGTLTLLARQWAVRRDQSLGVLFMAIAGFLIIGTFGSLLDTPWIVQLLCALLAVSWTLHNPSSGERCGAGRGLRN